MSNALDIFRGAKDTVPDIKFTIPSTGEDIYLRPFTTREQKAILKAIEKEDQQLMNEAFDQLITNCVVTKGFKVDDLLTKDRDILLIQLRKESVKEDFGYNWQCINEGCEQMNSETMALSKLKFKKLKSKDKLEQVIELSDRPIKLKLKLPTRKFEKMLYKHIGITTKDSSVVDVMNTTLAISIDSIIIEEDGKDKELDVKFNDRINILEEMSIDDKSKIEKFLKGIDAYGYDLNIGVRTCKSCSKETEVELNWSDFFLM